MSTGGVLGFGFVAGLILVFVALTGLPIIAIILALATLVLGGAVFLMNRSASTGEIARRKNWERPAVLAVFLLFPLAATGVALDIHLGWPRPLPLGSRALWRGLAIDAAAVAIVFYLSSLIDWCYVIPRLKGLGEPGLLPCQSSTRDRWQRLTRYWLAHRILAYLIGRVGPLAAAVLILIRFHPKVSNSAATAVATVIAALIVFYLNRIIPIGGLVTNPSIQVGDKVVLAEEFGTGVDERPEYYIVDVAIEGVKLLEVGEGDQPSGTGLNRGHDRSLSLADVSRLLRSRQPFQGCGEKCCGANHYCPLNRGQLVEDGFPPWPPP